MSADQLPALLRARERQTDLLATVQAENAELRAELDETNTGLLAVYAELQTANQRIADLVAMLSHDIRQPLGVVIINSALLLADWEHLTDAERLHDISRISAAAAHMTQLVEEILTLTQLDARGLGTRPQPVDVRAAVADAIDNVAGAEPGSVTLHDGPGCWALVDPRHLHQLLTNLLSNAFKYGKPPVEITVTSAPERVAICVRDHGDGVPGAFVPHLFERFSRAETAPHRAQGTGLGLYIVLQLAEANGGEVGYQDHPDGGGCFTLKLPTPDPLAEDAAAD